MDKFRNILWGLVFVTIGIILGGNALGFFNINLFFNGWWTLFLIVPSFINFFTQKDKTGSIIVFLIGVALLLGCRDLLDFDMIWKLILPAILIIIGVSVIFKDTISSKVSKEIKKINKENKCENEYCATFSGQDVNFNNEEFKGANIDAIFGGVKMDLTNAIVNSDQVINCSSIFGGVDIIIPENLNIKVKSSSMFGGVSNTKHTKNIEGAKTIYINAKCLFGGVEIK